MKVLLVSEGSSDRMLLHPIRWILGSDCETDRADLSRLRVPPKNLTDKIRTALKLHHPCDLLVVHRDADSAGSQVRRTEIAAAVQDSGFSKPWISIVPERMTEAWFLFNEQAIRAVVSKPNGRTQLELPQRDWDQIADPKKLLYETLRKASERTGRDAAKFNVGMVCHQLAEDLTDFSPLRSLKAFQLFEEELKEAAHRARQIRGS